MSADDLKTRLAAAKAKLDAHAARDAEVAKAYAEADEVDALELRVRLADALAEAEAKYGRVGRDIEVVRPKFADGAEAGAIIVRRGDAMHWSRYRNTIGEKKGIEIEQTTDTLWRPAVVWPTLGEVDALAAKLPHTKTMLAEAVAALNGVRLEGLAGK